MAERFDFDAIAADDALLDMLADGGDVAGQLREAGDDPAIQLLAGLRLAVEQVDDRPSPVLADSENFLARVAARNPVNDPLARKIAARGLALSVAAVAALSVSGVAAAVNGDPLSPYEKIVERVVDAVSPQTTFPVNRLDGLVIGNKAKMQQAEKELVARTVRERDGQTRVADKTGQDSTISADILGPVQRTVARPPLVTQPEEKPSVEAKPDVKPTAAPTQPPSTMPEQPVESQETAPPQTQPSQPVATVTSQPTSEPTPTDEPSATPTETPTDPPSNNNANEQPNSDNGTGEQGGTGAENPPKTDTGNGQSGDGSSENPSDETSADPSADPSSDTSTEPSTDPAGDPSSADDPADEAADQAAEEAEAAQQAAEESAEEGATELAAEAAQTVNAIKHVVEIAVPSENAQHATRTTRHANSPSSGQLVGHVSGLPVGQHRKAGHHQAKVTKAEAKTEAKADKKADNRADTKAETKADAKAGPMKVAKHAKREAPPARKDRDKRPSLPISDQRLLAAVTNEVLSTPAKLKG